MFLAIKDFKYNKSRYSLIAIMLILLTFMVLFLSGIANGLSLATSASIKHRDADYYVLSEDSDSIITRSSLSKEQFSQIVEMTNSEVTPIHLMRMNFYQESSQKKLDITYFAIDPDSFMLPANVEKSLLSEEPYSIILNKSFQEEGIDVGDIIKDATSGIQLKVVGFVNNEMYGHSAVGFLSLESFTTIRTAITSNYETTYQAFAIKGNDVNKIDLEGTVVLSKADIIQNIPGYAQEQLSLQMILWVLVLISGVVLGVFFYILTMQKQSEFGVMKALGMEMRMLSSVILCQVIFLAGGSMLIGNILTFVMASVLPASMPFSLQISSAAFVSAAFMMISILLSMFSLRKVAKIDPLMTIGGQEA